VREKVSSPGSTVSNGLLFGAGSSGKIGEIMRIWGGILPFIGFKKFYVDERGFPLLNEEANPIPVSPWWSDVFTIEWLGRGILLFTTRIRRVE
jgi:hypothetical protein